MSQYHMISAKRMGWDQMYDYYPFPTDKYSKESALALFCPVTKTTMKNNGWYEYTAYEFKGEVYYDIIYDGIYDESNLIDRGYTIEELNNIEI